MGDFPGIAVRIWPHWPRPSDNTLLNVWRRVAGRRVLTTLLKVETMAFKQTAASAAICGHCFGKGFELAPRSAPFPESGRALAALAALSGGVLLSCSLRRRVVLR